MGLQSLGSAGQVEGIWVSVQQVLEGLQGGLAGLNERTMLYKIWVFSPLPLLSHPRPPRSWEKQQSPGSQAWLLLRPITKCMHLHLYAGNGWGPVELLTSVVFQMVHFASCPDSQLSQSSALPIPLCSAAAPQPC